MTDETNQELAEAFAWADGSDEFCITVPPRPRNHRKDRPHGSIHLVRLLDAHHTEFDTLCGADATEMSRLASLPADYDTADLRWRLPRCSPCATVVARAGEITSNDETSTPTTEETRT